MAYSFLVALTRFVEGREDDFNDWYSWVHLRDVMRLGLGVIAAQRFRRSDAARGLGESVYDQPYLAIYEVTDAAAMTRAHAPVFTDDMPVSDAYRAEAASEVYFDEISGFSSRPGVQGDAAVLVERIDAAACTPAAREAFHRRFLRARHLPGIVAGSLTVPNPHQMFEQPLSVLCAIYWTGDLAATVSAWPAIGSDEDAAAIPSALVSIDAYEPIIDRLTMIAVREPSTSDEAQARAARVRLGDRVMRGPPASIVTGMFD